MTFLVILSLLLIIPLVSSFQPSSRLNRCTRKSALHSSNKVKPLEKPTVAIIGGGVAGLSCAHHLKSAFHPVVFDTGRLRPGGRCSSRYPHDKPKHVKQNKDSILSRYTIDHAAQIVSVPYQKGFEKFKEQVDLWVELGVLKRFPKDSVVEIMEANGNEKKKKKKKIDVKSLDSSNMFYGSQGIGSIPLNIINDCSMNETSPQIYQDQWISPSNGLKFVGTNNKFPKWSVQSNEKKFGSFDYVVIAHNGKCAERITSRTPAKDIHSLLKVNFRSYVPKTGGWKMTLNSIYSLTVALKKINGGSILDGIDQNGSDRIITGFVKNEPVLNLFTIQSRKFDSESRDMEVCTLLSSSTFAQKYKAPQENLSPKLIEEVTQLMLEGFERCIGLTKGTIIGGDTNIVLDSKLQLWGAAVPLNVWSVQNNNTSDKEQSNDHLYKSGFLYDTNHSLGVCGDWLLDPSIAGAWESGRRLANWMISRNQEPIGLPPNGEFIRAHSESSIGSIR